MSTYFSLLFVLAYFSVFIVGLITCYHVTCDYFLSRHFFKAGSTGTLALLAIGGLVQALIGA